MPKQYDRRIIVTGGAGFIGCNLLRYMVPKYPNYLFINVDSLTYAGNLSNLQLLEGVENYRFEKIDIVEYGPLADCFEKYAIDGVIHLAAESHVDRSIIGPAAFVQSNIIGTFNLLEAVRSGMTTKRDFRFAIPRRGHRPSSDSPSPAVSCS